MKKKQPKHEGVRSPAHSCAHCGQQVRILQGTVLGCVTVDAETASRFDYSFDRKKGHVPHWKTCPSTRASRVRRIKERILPLRQLKGARHV